MRVLRHPHLKQIRFPRVQLHVADFFFNFQFVGNLLQVQVGQDLEGDEIWSKGGPNVTMSPVALVSHGIW